jgi:hypothetical protein
MDCLSRQSGATSGLAMSFRYRDGSFSVPSKWTVTSAWRAASAKNGSRILKIGSIFVAGIALVHEEPATTTVGVAGVSGWPKSEAASLQCLTQITLTERPNDVQHAIAIALAH